MRDHETRVLKECVELSEKIVSLEKFIGGQIYQSLTLVDQDLLVAQHSAMRTYESILNMRIARFKE